MKLKLSLEGNSYALSNESKGVTSVGKTYTIQQQQINEVWVPCKNIHDGDNVPLPFKLQELVIDSQTGKLSGGKIHHGFGKKAMSCKLQPKPK